MLAREFEGKRLNSPNDLVYKSDGALYFTDPPAGLRNGNDDPKKELPFTGIYLLKENKLQLVAKDLRPNGLAFTPDEKNIYLVDTTGGKKTIVRSAVNSDDTFGPTQLFIDMTSDKAPGGPGWHESRSEWQSLQHWSWRGVDHGPGRQAPGHDFDGRTSRQPCFRRRG